MTFLLLTTTSAMESNLTLDPPGPVAVFYTSIKYYNRFLEKVHEENVTPMVIKCISSGNHNITWDIPVLNFGELADRNVSSVSIFIQYTPIIKRCIININR